MKHLPFIDGLRAVAVLPIILFHLDKTMLPGGALGVDVFFVISGFLITSIIYAQLQAGTFSFRAFWSRRIRRILPAVGTMVFVTLCAFALLGFPGLMIERAIGGFAATAMVANFHYFLHFTGDYWGPQSASSPFLHTWSLAIEEQFYLLFPLCIYYIFKYRPKWLGEVIFFISAVSFFLFLWLSFTKPTFAFYMLPTRGWELGVGCILAILHVEPCQKRTSEKLVGGGLLLTIVTFTMPLDAGPSPLANIAAVLGTGMIIWGGAGSSLARVVLANTPAVWIGKISFSLYLWHWPVIVLAEEAGLAANIEPQMWSLFAVIITLSMVSYFLIEQPVRTARGSITLVLAFPMTAIAVSFALTELGPLSSAGLPGYSTPRYAGPAYDLSPVQPVNDDRYKSNFNRIATQYRPNRKTPIYKSGGLLLEHGQSTRILALGDSHALMWAPAFEKLAIQHQYSVFISGMTAGHPYFDFTHPEKLSASERATLEQRLEIAERRRELVDYWKPELVIVTTRELPDQIQLDAFTTYFQSRGIPLLFIGQPPVLAIGNRAALEILSYAAKFRTIDPSEAVLLRSTEEHEHSISILSQLQKNCDSCYLFDTSNYIATQKGQAIAADNGVIYYHDDDHLSVDGAISLSPHLQSSIDEILNREHR